MSMIETNADVIRRRASELSDKLARYELALSKGPNKIEAMVYRPHLSVEFHKKGSEWGLSATTDDVEAGNPTWRDVGSVSIVAKTEVAFMLLDLPEAMEEARRAQLDDMDQASGILDELLARTQSIGNGRQHGAPPARK